MARQFGGCSQHRDTGVRHSNPKPPPTKKAPRVGAEARDKWSWEVWNRRRSLKVQRGDVSEDFVGQAYENITIGIYKHNLAARERYLETGGRWREWRMSQEFVVPERYTQKIAPKKRCNRQALGSEPTKKLKRQFKRVDKASTDQSQRASGCEKRTDLECYTKELECLSMEDDDMEPYELAFMGRLRQQQATDDELDWEEVKLEKGSSSAKSDEEEYVVI